MTVAEWTLGKNGNPDNYDGTPRPTPLTSPLTRSPVSLVDGFNIPMSVVPTAGCHEASCTVDLNPGCKSLRGM